MSSVEALSTLFTAKRTDLSVETLVVPQEVLQGETLPTNITGVWSFTRVKQHVCIEASLERKPSVTLRTVERLLCVRPMHSLVGFELQQLGEGFPAVFAAQRMLVLTMTVLLHSASMGLGLYNTFGSSG